MNMFMYLLVILIALCLIIIEFIIVYNRYQSFIIRINEAESHIDSVLRKRFDLLNKSIGIIKTNKDVKGNVLSIIEDLRSRKLSNFELDRSLYDAINEFHTYKEKHESLRQSEEFTKIDLGIQESEAEIIALRKYYNDIITEYNKLIRVFPSNIVGKICRYKLKTYFDGKDMTDEDINDFKL